MLLLALDTSTRQASIALCSEDEILGEYSWQSGNNHSVELLDRVRRLMAEGGKGMSELDGVAVARGPGSFNGLRVALAVAKALAFALHKPLVGMSTLDVIAAQQGQWHGPVCALLEAGRSELYAACYVFDEMHSDDGVITQQMLQLSDYLLDTPQHLAAYLQTQANDWFGVPGERQLPPFLFCGELSAASREALRQHMQANSLFIPSIAATRHASTLAILAFQQLREGQADDPLLLEPLYLRRPSITTSARKQPLLDGSSHRPDMGVMNHARTNTLPGGHEAIAPREASTRDVGGQSAMRGTSRPHEASTRAIRGMSREAIATMRPGDAQP